MIRVLHVMSTLEGGSGVGMMLYNYYNHMNCSELQFDFIIHADKIGALGEKFIKTGSKIYHVTPRRVSLRRNISQMNKIIKEGSYDVVHCHMSKKNAFATILAKKHGVNTIASHSHASNMPENSYMEKMLDRILVATDKKCSNKWLACTGAAAKWAFGAKAVEEGRVHIIKNAIELERFAYNEQLRTQIRKELASEDKLVIGNVGRLVHSKNHAFLLDIFREVLSLHRGAELWIIGEGKLRAEIEDKIKSLGLSASVKLLGERDDVSKLMQGTDVFVFPSKHEGLGIVLIEAQATGLPCVASDCIPKDVRITDNVHMISLERGAREWADAVIKCIGAKREADMKLFKNAGYDIRKESEKLKEIYMAGN